MSLVLLRCTLGRWLRVTPYFLGGFGSLLSYLLMLRLGRMQYVYHYVPFVSDPVVFTPIIDIVVWIAIAATLCGVGSWICWREYERWKAATLITLMSAAIIVAIVTVLAGGVSPWLITFSTMPIIYLICRPIKGLARLECLQTTSFAMALTWFLIELGSACLLLLRGLGVYPFWMNFERQILGLSINIMYALHNCSVLLLFLVGLSWTAAPFLLSLDRRGRFEVPFKPTSSAHGIVLTSILLSSIAMMIPYIERHQIFGVDTRYYLEILMSTSDTGALLTLLPTDPRSVYVLFLKALTILGLSSDLAVRIGPVILMMLNAVAFYFLGAEIAEDRFAGALVAAFSALGLQTSVSLYAGIYANWLSMLLAALAFFLYLRAVKTGKSAFFVLVWLLIVACLVSHPWSGLIYSLTLVLLCVSDGVLSGKRCARKRIHDLALASAIVLTSVAGYLYIPYAGVVDSIRSLHSSFQVSNLEGLVPNLSFTIEYMVGGFLSAPIVYITALAGFGGLCFHRERSSGIRLVILWLIATFLPILFADQWLQWRLIYLMPTQILSGLGIYYLSNLMVQRSGKASRVLPVTFLSVVILAMFNYLLRNVGFIPSF